MLGSNQHTDQQTRLRHVVNNVLTAAMAMILATSVIGSAAVWRNQAIIQATQFTKVDGANILLQMANFQTEVMRIISELPPDDWEDRIILLERRLQDLQVMVARLNGDDR